MDTENIIEIQQIKDILSKDKNLLLIFNQLLKVINNKINNGKLEDVLVWTDTETEDDFSVYSEDEI
tara:strand:+ start:248 stop:445 length:198 start_codon:yes stop_codon:yes gene_type:complete